MATTTRKMPLTGIPEADELLVTDPFALLVGMLLDQQVPMTWAFKGPYTLLGRLGTLDPTDLAALGPDAVIAACCEKPAVHRFPASMGARVHELAAHVAATYGGDAGRIWKGVKDPAVLMERLRALPGYGDEKARILLAILGKRWGVAPKGWQEIAGAFGTTDPRSVADVDSAESLARVQAFKKQLKAAGKAKDE